MALNVVTRGRIPGTTLETLYQVPPGAEFTIRSLRVSPTDNSGTFEAYVEVFFAGSNIAVPIFNEIPVPFKSAIDIVDGPYLLASNDIIRVRNVVAGKNAFSMVGLLKTP